MNESNQNYAGFWRRFAAYGLDWVILIFVINSLHGNLTAHLRNFLYDSSYAKELLLGIFEKLPFLWLGLAAARRRDYYYLIDPVSNRLAFFVMIPISFIIVWCYFSGLESSPLKSTFGKYAVGIYVTDIKGNRISFGRATGRYFAKIISGSVLIGYLMAGFTEKKQALHDFIAECLVLSK